MKMVFRSALNAAAAKAASNSQSPMRTVRRAHTIVPAAAASRLAGPAHRVSWGADAGECPGCAEIGRQFGPFDLTMLEIGAFDPLWADIHMGPEGAIRSFRALGGHGLLMPIHWGLFDLALQPWTKPIESVF